MRAIHVFSLLILTTADRKLDILNLYKNSFTGDGTYYWNTEGGTCSYPPPELPPVAYHPNITDLVALNSHQFFGSHACGMCFSVNGSGVGLGLNPIIGQHIVFVKDMCPECKKGDVDFSETADGRWNISIRAIQCPVGNTSIEYKFQGSNEYYLKLQVRNARIPATSFEVKLPDMSWSHFNHTMDGFWTVSFPTGVTYPIHLRLTAANGEVIEDTLGTDHIVNEKVIYGDGKQFSVDNSLPT
ncbi:Expansin-YoaJ [Mizuhopecten yessoensis]|uniref:Expansin-YoaJ n=2 Tax=Mizuhopecten yessoensis TaxID=6573 RepID=A0A210QW07_MIZYE|nr:Expansin-YoaJ [Mizuhopecten yessoensis]